MTQNYFHFNISTDDKENQVLVLRSFISGNMVNQDGKTFYV